MISVNEAKTNYGFRDASEKEDEMVLGLYQAADALFSSRFMQLAESSAPLVIVLVAYAALAGIAVAGFSPLTLLMPAAMAFAFFPYYMKKHRQHRENSGLCHIEKEQGTHFLIAFGTCSKKYTMQRKTLFGTVTDYKLRIVFPQHVYLDNVLTIKELYGQIGEGSRVCLMLADSPSAHHILAAPAAFSETVLVKKSSKAQSFQASEASALRILNAEERSMYREQYQGRIDYWNRNYGRKYLAVILLFFLFGCISLYFAQQGATLLSWILVLTCGVAVFAQKQEFRSHMKLLSGTSEIKAVDVTVAREKGWNEALGTQKRPNSAVLFQDARGNTLWTLRTSEDLKAFRYKESAILIQNGKNMIVLHKNTSHYRIPE